MAKGKYIKARILFGTTIFGIALVPNDVVEGDTALIKELEKGGGADTSGPAVTYALSLKKDVIKLVDPHQEQVEAAEEKVATLTTKLAAAADADKVAVQAELDAATAELEALK